MKIFEKQRIIEFGRMSFSLVTIQLSVFLPFLICAYFIGRFESPIPLAAYGLSNTFTGMTFNSFLTGVQESMGIKTGYCFHSK